MLTLLMVSLRFILYSLLMSIFYLLSLILALTWAFLCYINEDLVSLSSLPKPKEDELADLTTYKFSSSPIFLPSRVKKLEVLPY